MKNIDFDKTWIGAIAGLLVPFIALITYYLINYNYMSIHKFIGFLKIGNAFTPLITLCVLANLAAFYLFLWKEKYKGTRGVIASTFLWAMLIIFLKFFT